MGPLDHPPPSSLTSPSSNVALLAAAANMEGEAKLDADRTRLGVVVPLVET
jgi:hypothetical protein